MLSAMNYDRADQWILAEKGFSAETLGKCEAVMCLGNGYMGLRSALEERYVKEKRNLFVAGTFNKADPCEVTELPNAADVTHMELYLESGSDTPDTGIAEGHGDSAPDSRITEGRGDSAPDSRITEGRKCSMPDSRGTEGCERFTLESGMTESSERCLDLRTGELVRNVIWISPGGKKIRLTSRRIVSMKRMHVIAQQVSITPLSSGMKVRLRTGIDGQVTNSGAQHFLEKEKRFYNRRFMQYTAETVQSGIVFVTNTAVKREDPTSGEEGSIGMGRRRLWCDYEWEAKKDETITFEKISNVHTLRDREHEGKDCACLQRESLEELEDALKCGYAALAEESARAWKEKVWDKGEITVESENELDALAVHFAQYHLAVMTPAHDERMSIGAKGLSGEGYKGHTFWDADSFVLPYFIFTFPDTARNLVKYRYLTLPGAHRKAAENGFEGAQFPWESAWYDDGEVTPAFGGVDVVTGKPQTIWSGKIELHITADVAFALWQYYQASQDERFMEEYGFEILLDTAKFWSSRLEYSEEDGRYHINDVIGPDEYKEHVDDNAYTNYMAWWNITKALACGKDLVEKDPALWKYLEEKLSLAGCMEKWQKQTERIFLPEPGKGLVIPQDRTYLTLEEIDLTKYKEQEEVLMIYRDYNAEQINRLQVSKQADILILFYLLENYFTEEVKKANWEYYEPRTLHDSSLSLSTHCILANDIGDKEKAYELFQKSLNIDMGPFMKGSDEGIHSASIGGIWQSVVFGFGGVRMLDGKLRIRPSLPRGWSRLAFYLCWHGQELYITIAKERVQVQNRTKTKAVWIEICGETYQVMEEIQVYY